jgi:hypothetical protein
LIILQNGFSQKDLWTRLQCYYHRLLRCTLVRLVILFGNN